MFAYLEWAVVQNALRQQGSLALWFLPIVILVPIATLLIYFRAAVHA